MTGFAADEIQRCALQPPETTNEAVEKVPLKVKVKLLGFGALSLPCGRSRKDSVAHPMPPILPSEC